MQDTACQTTTLGRYAPDTARAFVKGGGGPDLGLRSQSSSRSESLWVTVYVSEPIDYVLVQIPNDEPIMNLSIRKWVKVNLQRTCLTS
jgi:hypothetical protein